MDRRRHGPEFHNVRREAFAIVPPGCFDGVTTPGGVGVRGVVLAGAWRVGVELGYPCVLGVPVGEAITLCWWVSGWVGIIGGPGVELVIDLCAGISGSSEIQVGGSVEMELLGDGGCVQPVGEPALVEGALQGVVRVCCDGWVQVRAQGVTPDGLGFQLTTPPRPITLDPGTPPPLVCQAGLEITAPGPDTTLMIGPDPTMPLLEAMARITGVEPDPTNQTDFTWAITVSYTTRQTRPRTLSESFTARARGGQLPENIWGASIVGGHITIQALAQVVVEGDLASVSDIVEGPVLRGENPPQAAIQQRLDNGDAEQTTWLRKIACQES
ncbi:MAG: hypothetical protein D6723_19570, partial [Acidobacteria bacterium]